MHVAKHSIIFTYRTLCNQSLMRFDRKIRDIIQHHTEKKIMETGHDFTSCIKHSTTAGLIFSTLYIKVSRQLWSAMQPIPH